MLGIFLVGYHIDIQHSHLPLFTVHSMHCIHSFAVLTGILSFVKRLCFIEQPEAIVLCLLTGGGMRKQGMARLI